MNLKKAKEITQNLFRERIKKGTWKSYSHEELKKNLKQAGYTDEEAEEILKDHTEVVIIPYFEKKEHTRLHNTKKISYLSTSEDILIEYYCKKLEPKIEGRWKMEAKDYILRDMMDEKDETERQIREIYATKNVK